MSAQVKCPNCRLSIQRVECHQLTYVVQDVDLSYDPEDMHRWGPSEWFLENSYVAFYRHSACGAVLPSDIIESLALDLPEAKAAALLPPLDAGK